jgi:2'-5' RNA ligase
MPAQFRSRWEAGAEHARPSFEDAVCWHLLLGGDPGARAAAAGAQRRLARFAGLHMTPLRWLHVTVLRVGPADRITQADMRRMLATAQGALAGTPPVTVALERVYYHPEAIAVSVAPASALAPVLAAARAAVSEATGADDPPGDWAPHVTLCYSTAEQDAGPVIAGLGRALPPCEVTIREMSLVVQDGPEDRWNWHVAGTARLLGKETPPGT